LRRRLILLLSKLSAAAEVNRTRGRVEELRLDAIDSIAD